MAASLSTPIKFTTVTDDVGSAQGNALGNGAALTSFTTFKGGDYTDDSRPTFAGTAAPGALIAITQDNVRIGTTTAGADGGWSYTPATPMSNVLAATFTAWALDAAGQYNYSDPTQSATIKLTVDAAATPPLPAQAVHINGVWDDVGPVQGNLLTTSDDFVTLTSDDSQLTITGTALPSSKFWATLITPAQYGPSVALASDAEGHWSYTMPAGTAAGVDRFSIIYNPYTLVRNDLASDAVTFRIDAGTLPPPVITGLVDHAGTATPSGAASTDRQPTLSGTSAPGTTVEVYDNGQLIGHVVTAADWTWQFSPATPLEGTSHQFTVVASDPSGGQRTPAPYSWDLSIGTDTAGAAPLDPVITALIDDAGTVTGTLAGEYGVTDDTRPTLQGTSEPGTRVELFDNGVKVGEALAGADWQWSITPAADLSSGEHAFSARAWSANQLASTPTVYDFPVHIGAGGGRTMLPPVITDVLYDGVTPRQSFRVGEGGSTLQTLVHLQGTAEPGTQVKIYEQGVLIGQGITGADWQWSIKPTHEMAAGHHAFTAEASWRLDGGDPVSSPRPYECTLGTTNVSILAPGITSFIDDIGPVRFEQTVGADPVFTDDMTPTLKGVGQAGTVVTVYSNTLSSVETVLGTTVVDANGQWSLTTVPAVPATAHDYTLSVTATSADGLESSIGVNTFIVAFDPATDLTEPTLASLTDHVGAIQGTFAPDTDSSSSLFVTDDPHPTLHGQADPGSIIALTLDALTYGGTRQVEYTTTDAQGQWAITPSQALLQGTAYNLSVTARYQSDPSQVITSLDWTDQVPTLWMQPVGGASAASRGFLRSMVDDVGAVQGTLPATDGVTDDRQLTFSGVTTPFSPIDTTENLIARWTGSDGQVHTTGLGYIVPDATTGAWSVTATVPIDCPANTLVTLGYTVNRHHAPGYTVDLPNSFIIGDDSAAGSLDTLLSQAGLTAQAAGPAGAISADTAQPVAQAALYTLQGAPAHELAY